MAKTEFLIEPKKAILFNRIQLVHRTSSIRKDESDKKNIGKRVDIEHNEKHALWYMPTGEIYLRFKDIIMQLSEKYSTPAFEPHITVIGGLKGKREELLMKSASIAAVINPHKIVLLGLESLDEFYRCLFLRAEDTTELIKTNLEAKKIFERKGNLNTCLTSVSCIAI